MSGKTVSLWILICAAILAVIIVPFLVLGTEIEVWAEEFTKTAFENKPLVGVVLGLLLASDIVLPIPSSLVSTAGGAMLGWLGGFLISLVGMSVASVIGYWLGKTFGRSMAQRLVGEDELTRLEVTAERYGSGVIVLFRAVPVLAEASVLLAGMSRMKPSRFLLLSTLSNAGISAVYATIGAYSASVNSFLLAFVGALIIPLVATLLLRNVPRVRQQATSSPQSRM